MATTSFAASSPSERRGFTVGLTGGIGSGKSAVADCFAALGSAIVDSDEIARSLTAAGGAAIGVISDAFGAEFITREGALDRARMRALVFNDPAARARLEAILHPQIRERTEVAAAEATVRGGPYVVLVVPLLVESGTWRSRVDRLLVIDCSTTTQEARVRARSGLDASLTRSIIAQQATRTQRLDAADDVLVNEGRMTDLVSRVARLHRRYCRLASAAPRSL